MLEYKTGAGAGAGTRGHGAQRPSAAGLGVFLPADLPGLWGSMAQTAGSEPQR
jgi:hypothetical protein